MKNKYYYFSTHTLNESVYGRLESNHEFSLLSDEIKETITKFVSLYPKKGESKVSPMDYCSLFMLNHKEELHDLITDLGSQSTKYFLSRYLGYSLKWGASTISFGKSSSKRAEEISEEELIEEMTSEKGTIKKLLNSAHSDLTAVKPFLPAIMISLDTNTRNKELMEFTHTGRFCFDFDAFKDSKEALKWMNMIWKGTTNIKPYMAFLSPRGKGFKVFCRVDKTDEEFKRDYISGDREVIMKHHKVWYEGAKVELLKKHPSLIDNFDDATKDPQRLTYIPFIKDKSVNFKYEKDRISSYSKITAAQKKKDRNELLKKISKNSSAVDKIMREQGIKSKEDAYHLYLKSRQDNFDLELETEKFIQVIDFLEDLMMSDNRVSNWVYENFNDYSTLHKMSWVLFGVFGEIAIDNLKRLVPSGSNKLDESHNDYRWAIRSKDDYDDDQLNSITPGAFYALVQQLGEVKDFLAENFRLSSKSVSELKLLNGYYDTYEKNRDLSNDEATANKADLSEFLDEITNYLNKKKVRLPLIDELETIPAEITLGKNDFLDKSVLEDLFQNKYADKRIFCLRSQCGSGKNSIAGHPIYKMKGRTILSEPFIAIPNQIAKEAWDEENRPYQIFVNSNIDETVKNFKKTNNETLKVNCEKTLKGLDIPKHDELVIHCTYNQILNLSHEDMATFDYIFIDEAHTLSSGIDYRAEVISGLIYHIIKFVAKKRNNKTKIIFMTGTPNVETYVIAEIMEQHQIGSLFQRIIVDKKYKVKPTIRLTHLDTDDQKERSDAVISQMQKYLKQGRKVCHIFNHKVKMVEYQREIQVKLSSSIKIGLFYSKSEGECTQNILSGKFGDYDVVLVTTFFINGININKDGLTEADVEEGKTSTQKYGLVLDLGNIHTKVNAIDTIQAINRFRNRLCESTVFIPKIFKPNTNGSSSKFDFRNAGKVLLGINSDNYHLLTVNKDVMPNESKEVEADETLHFLKEVRENPLLVSRHDISASTIQEENKNYVVSSITKKNRIYEDWFYSLDGYHYLAKDAGLTPILMHKNADTSLQEMTEDQVELENNLIRNFLDNEKALDYLENQIDPEKRISVKASEKIIDPLDTTIGNFSVKGIINDKFILEGDFHISHERAVNKLIKSHLSLFFLYNKDKAIEVLRALINPDIALLPSRTPSHLKNIIKYVSCCNFIVSDKFLMGINYIKGLDYLSTKKLGIVKETNENNISYTITNDELVTTIKEMWAKQQHDLTMYKINTSKSKDKDELKQYYSKIKLVKKMDLEELATQLDKISDYRPLKYTKSGKLKNKETIIIPRVIRSIKLSSPLNIDIEKFSEPELSTLKDNKDEIEKFYRKNKSTLKTLKKGLKTLTKRDKNKVSNDRKSLKSSFKKKDFQNSLNLVDSLLENPVLSKKPRILKSLMKLKNDLINLDSLLLTCFKTSEYMTYKDLTTFKYIPFVHKTFFCEEDFKLEDLDSRFTSKSEAIEDKDVFNFLEQNSNLFKNKRKVKLGKPKTTKTSYVVLNKKDNILYANFSLSETCKFLCNYAFKNDGFVMKDGSTPLKVLDKGIYNSDTFKRDYYSNSSTNKTVSNYFINTFDFYTEDYKDYLNQQKALPKSKGKVA